MGDVLNPCPATLLRTVCTISGTFVFSLCFAGCRAPVPGSPATPVNASASSPAKSPQPPAVPAGSQEDEPPTDPRLADVQAALERQDYGRALKACREAHQKGVPLAAILEQKAAIFMATAYLDKELETLVQWSSIAPKDPRPWYKRFYIYMDMGWHKEAEEASAKVMQIAPENARSHVTCAILRYRSSEPALGVRDIEKAERLAPNNNEYLNLHATILMKEGKPAEAEAILRKLVDRAPHEAPYRLALAQALARSGKEEESATLLRTLQTELPDSVEVAYESGLLAEKRHDLPEAARHFEKAVSLDPGYGNVLFCLGRIYLRQKRIEEGKALQKRFQTMDKLTGAFETALNRLRTRPDDPALHHQLAKAYLADNELPQAILELRRVQELRPNHAQARRDLVDALTKHGRVTEARQLAETSSKP